MDLDVMRKILKTALNRQQATRISTLTVLIWRQPAFTNLFQ
jgi:hypothetical protein